MKLYLGVTNNKWYRFLRELQPDEVNFWQPGEQSVFKALQTGDMFLFKLKSPLHAIGGLGFFSNHTRLPLNMAWDVFGEQNGCAYEDDFRRMILNYRDDKYNFNPSIGCIVLTNPLFFDDDDFIPVPELSNSRKSHMARHRNIFRILILLNQNMHALQTELCTFHT